VVAGAATAAVAAQNLQLESGIASLTVAQWVHRIRSGEGLSGVEVLVLDEANLTDDRDRAALYEAAARAGTKLVEVGDPQQLRGWAAGCCSPGCTRWSAGWSGPRTGGRPSRTSGRRSPRGATAGTPRRCRAGRGGAGSGDRDRRAGGDGDGRLATE